MRPDAAILSGRKNRGVLRQSGFFAALPSDHCVPRGLAFGPDGTITLRVTDEDMRNRSTDEFMQVPLFSRSGDTNWGRIEFRYSLHPS